jgi:tetratricopeptide (TPR) repeat protein
MAADAFISYSHDDKDVAEAACLRLEASGVHCWIAPRDILPGSTWPGQIVTAINDCKAFVLIYSSSANASEQIKHEVERAGNRGMPIIPFRIENVPPSPDLAYFISNAQWLDAFEQPMEPHLDRLSETIARISGTAQAPKPSPAPVPPRARFVGRGVVVAVLVLILAGLGAWYFLPSRTGRSQQDDYRQGVAALEQKEYSDAIAKLTRAINRSPSPDAYYNRGLANYLSGNMQPAIDDWNRTLTLDPGSAMALRQRANAFVQTGDAARALLDYNRAIELAPQEPRAYYNRALLYQAAKEPAKAIADLQTALTLNPDAPLRQAAQELLNTLKGLK